MNSSSVPTAGISDTHRAEAFSDGVFAIIITLLVLDLESPPEPPGHLLRGLLEQWPAYLAYVTSYLYIAVVWLNHKAAFTRIRLMDRGLHWANLGILFTTALLPFPTTVIADAVQEGNRFDERVAVALYALIGTFLAASWLWFFRHLRRHPELANEGVSPAFFARESKRPLVGVFLYAIAGALGYFVAPEIALAFFLALPIFYGVTSHGLYTRFA